MKKKIVLKSMFIGILSLILTTPTMAKAYVISRSGGFYYKPAYISCSSSFSQATLTAVHNACVAWNNACTNGPVIYRTTSTHNTTEYPCQNGFNEITKGDRTPEDYLMETYHVVEDHIYSYEVDIDINTLHDFGTASTSYHTQSAILHELGHMLGLHHSENTSACMYGILSRGQVRGLHQDDINGINAIYDSRR